MLGVLAPELDVNDSIRHPQVNAGSPNHELTGVSLRTSTGANNLRRKASSGIPDSCRMWGIVEMGVAHVFSACFMQVCIHGWEEGRMLALGHGPDLFRRALTIWMAFFAVDGSGITDDVLYNAAESGIKCMPMPIASREKRRPSAGRRFDLDKHRGISSRA